MTKNFAHRGYSGKYPENTLLAFEQAMRCGADGIELDVQLSTDGSLVIIHDETVERTTGAAGRVMDLRLEQLRALDAYGRFKGQYDRQPIPTLEEYFTLVRQSELVTNIELKTGVYEYEGIEEKVYECIRKFGMQERVIISSFNHFSVLRMKKIAPMLKYGLLSETWLIDAGKYASGCGVQCYHPLFRNLIPDVVREIKDYGLEINTYTVNEERDVRNLAALGIDAVIGNYPEMTARVLADIAEGASDGRI